MTKSAEIISPDDLLRNHPKNIRGGRGRGDTSGGISYRGNIERSKYNTHKDYSKMVFSESQRIPPETPFNLAADQSINTN